jgi:hypothetical protein
MSLQGQFFGTVKEKRSSYLAVVLVLIGAANCIIMRFLSVGHPTNWNHIQEILGNNNGAKTLSDTDMKTQFAEHCTQV